MGGASVRIGVAAVQGAVSEHVTAFRDALDEAAVEGAVTTVRTLDEFMEVDALALPGGESTSISKLLVHAGIHDELRRRVKEEGMPVMGTCAGMIIMASEGDDEVARTGTKLLGLVDMAVDRNAFGRQRESFQAPVKLGLGGPRWEETFPGVFIRAPACRKVWGDCEVIGEFDGRIVAVRQGSALGLAFHPELSGDLSLHRHFISMIPGRD